MRYIGTAECLPVGFLYDELREPPGLGGQTRFRDACGVEALIAERSRPNRWQIARLPAANARQRPLAAEPYGSAQISRRLCCVVVDLVPRAISHLVVAPRARSKASAAGSQAPTARARLNVTAGC